MANNVSLMERPPTLSREEEALVDAIRVLEAGRVFLQRGEGVWKVCAADAVAKLQRVIEN